MVGIVFFCAVLQYTPPLVTEHLPTTPNEMIINFEIATSKCPTLNPRKMQHGFRTINAGISYALP